MGARILDFRLSCGTLRVACFHVRGASRREVVRLRSVERFWIKELKFNLKDALLRDALASKIPVRASVFVGAASPSGEGEGVRKLALSVSAASLRVAMPQALRCAIINSIIQN
ncbi:hypothetical protein [Nostoc sp.]|uniref:hypothetical protein n=1 Tax=Nostoc sp. TaxID=1180 RepID=UPI002FFB5760